MEQAPSPTPLERAVLTLLEPLVRLLLKRGVSCGEFFTLVKRVYVDVARRDFQVEGRKQSTSRIALMTGLTRKEVSRLTTEPAHVHTGHDRARVNRAARVLSAWVQEPDFADGRGQPRSLAFEDHADVNFSELVRLHAGDVPPRAVLDELLRVGAVRRLKDDRIRPVERAYVPVTDEAEKLVILGTDVADLVASIDHNMSGNGPEPFYQRKVAYDALPAASLPALRKTVRRDAQRLLERFDREMSRRDSDDPPADGAAPHKRAMVGIYYFEE
jgi:hypothetical protein